MSERYIIATSRPWYEPLAADLGKNFTLITRKEELTLARLHEERPLYVFFPHWSYIIPAEIYEAYPCVIFHMTDLPYGRGGSPLQNLIVRGHTHTKISALHCTKELDAGDIYLQEPLDLSGSAAEIFERCVPVIGNMIRRMVAERPTPVPQVGEPVIFTRRTPEQSDISGIVDSKQMYDHIRMLDAPGYPKAFIRVSQTLRVEFDAATWQEGELTARAQIKQEEI